MKEFLVLRKIILFVCFTIICGLEDVVAQNTGLSSGTGFFISNKGYIATCYHVIEEANWKNGIFVTALRGDYNKKYLAQVIATDPINDIAILKISDFGQISIPYSISSNVNKVATSVYTIGYPEISVMGIEPKFTEGKISATTGMMGDVTTYQITCPIQAGNSGGPLFNAKGEIIGIASSGLNRKKIDVENVNYAIKSSLLINCITSSDADIIYNKTSLLINKPITEQVELVKKNIVLILASASEPSQKISSTKEFVCGDQMKDYDGNYYNTVKIGNQCWMKENLRSIHTSGGVFVPLGSYNTSKSKSAYRYSTSNVSKYGYAYNYAAAVEVCPDGWHLPSKYEFEKLKKAIGYNLSLFSTFPCRASIYGGDNGRAIFASATIALAENFKEVELNVKYGLEFSYALTLDFDEDDITIDRYGTMVAHSVRCLRD